MKLTLGNDDTTVQYASGNLTPIELLHVHREGEGEGEGAVVKTLSSSCEPPRAWARERHSKELLLVRRVDGTHQSSTSTSSSSPYCVLSD